MLHFDIQVMVKMEELRKGVTKQEIAETKKIFEQKRKKGEKTVLFSKKQQQLGKESEGKLL